MSIRMKTEDGDIILSGKGKDGTGGIPVPQVAEVGQILAVKAVDASGKPTEWETISKGTLCDYSLDGTTLTITTL